MAVQKIDSNVTGLRYAEETDLKMLPANPTWHLQEPNSYKDFGGQVSTIARNPINPSRQRKKGTVTDLDASGGYDQDLTQNNTTRLLQGFFFADARQKATTAPLNGAGIVITGVTATEYAAAAGLGVFKAGMLVKASGFGVAANNGLKVVTDATATKVTVAGLAVEAAPPAEAKLEAVGFQLPVGEVDVSVAAGLPRLVNAAGGTVDFTTLGLIPGEWIFVGGDAGASAFANNGPGFARVNAVTAEYIELDKTDWTPVAEVAAGVTLRIFFGTVIKNEADPTKIKRRTYQLERTLGNDDDGPMAEYLVGAVCNEFALSIPQAEKVTAELSFVALDVEQRDGAQGLKDGVRPLTQGEEAFNTSSDFARIKLASVDPASSNPKPLFAFATELSLDIKNNVAPNKAVGILGAFDTSAGTFEVGGSLTAYFAGVAAVQAVRNNADVTIDIAIVKRNAGMVFDVPLLSLGDGRLAVEQDKPITLPLEVNAAESKFNHTLLFNHFPYLPNAAA